MVMANAAIFGALPMIQRHRRGGALINIRQPHMEGHGAQFEGQTQDDETQREDQHQIVRTLH